MHVVAVNIYTGNVTMHMLSTTSYQASNCSFPACTKTIPKFLITMSRQFGKVKNIDI